MLSIIAAVANNNVIGNSGSRGLLWRLPNDMAHFKKLTLNKTIIMGRNTYEAQGGPLVNRKNIVMSRDDHKDNPSQNLYWVKSIEDLQKYIDDDEEHFVIGGGTVFRDFIDKANKLYITRIYHNFDGTAYFPEIDETKWKIVSREMGIVDEKNEYEHEFLIYERI